MADETVIIRLRTAFWYYKGHTYNKGDVIEIPLELYKRQVIFEKVQPK